LASQHNWRLQTIFRDVARQLLELRTREGREFCSERMNWEPTTPAHLEHRIGARFDFKLGRRKRGNFGGNLVGHSDPPVGRPMRGLTFAVAALGLVTSHQDTTSLKVRSAVTPRVGLNFADS